MITIPDEKTKYVLLRNLDTYTCFFTKYDPQDTDVAQYGLIGYASTIREAQEALYGRSYTDRED